MKMEINCKLLDCTLRDGGYYTSWDFDTALIDTYTRCMGLLPVDYIEVGYRNNPSGDYMGKLGYTPLSVLRRIREQYTKKIVTMLNEKSTRQTLKGCWFPSEKKWTWYASPSILPISKGRWIWQGR